MATKTKTVEKKAVQSAAKKTTKAVAEKKTSTKAKSVKPKAVEKVEKVSVKKTEKVAEKKVAAKKTEELVTKVPAKKAEKVTKKSTAKTAAKTAKPLSTTLKGNSKELKKDTLAHSFSPEYLVLMQRDPNWMHAFWDISEERLRAASKGKGKIVLRLFDISSDLTVRRSKKKRFRDIEVPADARSWYVENPATTSCAAVLGSVSGKTFTPILESTPIHVFDTTANAPSSEDPFVKASLGGATMGSFMSSGFSSQTAKEWLNSLNLASSSESLSSGMLSSGALLAQGNGNIEVAPDSVNYGKDFFLWVKTRLIVYGGTRPDAHLQVRGEPFPLNPDGTFSFEQDLPDSTQVIPVFATDKDGDFPTTIVPIVVKRTK